LDGEKEQIFIVIAVAPAAPFILKRETEDEGDVGKGEIAFQNSTNFCLITHVNAHESLFPRDATFYLFFPSPSTRVSFDVRLMMSF
jgi:hypothetical protein